MAEYTHQNPTQESSAGEISSSQLDFFRMLDSKIEGGRDYDPENVEERANEETRVRDLLRTWETAAAAAAVTAAAVASRATPTHISASAPQSAAISLAGSSNNSAASSPRFSDMAHSNGAADLYGKRYTSREYLQWQQQQQSSAHQYVQQYHQQYYQQYQYQQHYPQPYQHQYYQFLTSPPSPKTIPVLSHQSSVGSPVLERTAKVSAGTVTSAALPTGAVAGSPRQLHHHHLANSIVQYKKCGGTRTELL